MGALAGLCRRFLCPVSLGVAASQRSGSAMNLASTLGFAAELTLADCGRCRCRFIVGVGTMWVLVNFCRYGDVTAALLLARKSLWQFWKIVVSQVYYYCTHVDTHPFILCTYSFVQCYEQMPPYWNGALEQTNLVLLLILLLLLLLLLPLLHMYTEYYNMYHYSYQTSLHIPYYFQYMHTYN